MDKSVNAVDDLSKCAERSDRNDSSLDILTLLVVSLEDLPGILGILLIGKSYLLGLGVDILDSNVDLIANAYDLGRMLESVP